MPYDEVFGSDPLEEEALITGLGGAPAEPDYGPLLPAQPTPEEIIWIKRMLAASAPKPMTAPARPTIGATPPAPKYSAPATSQAPIPMGPPPTMRASSPMERILGPDRDLISGTGLVSPAAEETFSRERAQFRHGGTEPGPTAMRAPSMGERIRGGLAGAYEGASKQPLGQLLDAIGVSSFGDVAAQLRGESEPPVVLGEAVDLPGSGPGQKVTKKAAAAAERAILEKLFPELDSYAKKKGKLKGDAILAALQGVPDISPATLTRAEKLAAKGKTMKPAEVVDTLMGVKHDRGRVLMDMKGRKLPKKHLPGAPIWVGTPADEQEALDVYLKIVEEGVPGSGFYDESGKAIYQATGENAPLAHQVGVAASATSPATSVGANTGFMLKGHGQAIAGAPVKTGRFPANMSPPIEEAYQGNIEYLGPKRNPFANQIAKGGGYATDAEKAERAVHDIWEGEAFRFIEPDGTPLRRGFSPAEHAWMDTMTDRAVADANARQLGGKTDWNTGSIQAAAWTGAKIRAGDIKPGDAAKSFADYMKNLEMQMGREVMPGSSQQHLPELTDPAMQQQYSDRLRGFLYDAQGRDRSALQKGILTTGSFEGPGIYKNQITPGTQAKMLVGPQGSGKTRMVEPSSMGLMKSHEAEYGLIGGQDASAGTMLESGALAGDRDMFDLTMPTGKLAVGDPLLSDAAVQRALAAEQIAVIPTETGARIKNIQMPPDEFAAFGKQLQQTVTGQAEHGKDLGFYMERPRVEGPAQFPGAPHGDIGQGWARTIRDEVPKGKELFNQGRARENAQAWHDADVFMRDTHGMTLNDTLQEVRRAIAQHGWDGVNVVAKKYGLPLAALMLMVQQTAPQEPPQQ